MTRLLLFTVLVICCFCSRVIAVDTDEQEGIPIASTAFIPGDQHSMEHVGTTASTSMGDGSFCHGMYMTMFMDGFHFSLGKVKQTCLNYYVSSWQLSESGKFRGAMLFSFLLAILSEGIAFGRALLLPHLPDKGTFRRLVLTFTYFLQQWLGTMLMLLSMMFSIELLLSVVAGLAVGHRMFTGSTQTVDRVNVRGSVGLHVD